MMQKSIFRGRGICDGLVELFLRNDGRHMILGMQTETSSPLES